MRPAALVSASVLVLSSSSASASSYVKRDGSVPFGNADYHLMRPNWVREVFKREVGSFVCHYVCAGSKPKLRS